MPFRDLEIEEHILDKIESKHGVTYDEAEQVFRNPKRSERRSRFGLYSIYGQTEAGRYLLVVVARKDTRLWQLVTARDLTQQERRMHQRNLGR